MKPGTFTQLFVQLVFSPKNREALLFRDIRPRVFEYMGGIVNHLEHKLFIINGMQDHVHILYGMNPKLSVADTVHEIKRASSLYINEQKFYKKKFTWQEGYGGFSYSKSQVHAVANYIQNQESHHRMESFRTEYLRFLDEFGIEYNPEYLFDFLD